MHYWLLKTEPGCFSIDDLAAGPDGTTGWDGVRNYQARNFMREMREGDLVLLYHSGGEPAAVGVAEVAREAHPDPTQFDPEERHFDPKSSPDSPRWDMVDVRHVETFAAPVALGELRGRPELAEMVILRRGNRLSVTPLTPDEFETVRAMGRAKDREATS